MIKNDDRISFFTKLYDLLNEYDVEFEVIMTPAGYESYPDGIEFMFNGRWDEDGEIIRPYSYIKTPLNIVDAQEIKDVLDNLLGSEKKE